MGDAELPYAGWIAHVDGDPIVAEFQRRRRRFVRFGVIPGCLAIPVAFLGPELATAVGLPAAIPVVVGVAAVLASAAVGLTIYRCPACGAHPVRSPSGGEARGAMIDPARCPTCGVRLR